MCLKIHQTEHLDLGAIWGNRAASYAESLAAHRSHSSPASAGKGPTDAPGFAPGYYVQLTLVFPDAAMMASQM